MHIVDDMVPGSAADADGTACADSRSVSRSVSGACRIRRRMRVAAALAALAVGLGGCGAPTAIGHAVGDAFHGSGWSENCEHVWAGLGNPPYGFWRDGDGTGGASLYEWCLDFHNRDINSGDARYGATYLHVAAGQGSGPEIIDHLVGLGADVEARMKDGSTPLHAAVENTDGLERQTALIDALLGHGADLDSGDDKGDTPLHRLAATYHTGHYGGHVSGLIPVLIGRGADVDATNDRGETPLHVAARTSNRARSQFNMEELLDGGADVSVRDNEGNLAADLVWISAFHGTPLHARMLSTDPRDQEANAILLVKWGEGALKRKDYATAHRFFRRASRLGNTEAHFRFGEMLYYGRGAETDRYEAENLFQMAAERGHAGALYGLGVLYRWKGQRDLSISYFRRSAVGGLPEAQARLGDILAIGRGFEGQDYLAAHVWYAIAHENGHFGASFKRTGVERHLSREQVEEARLLARRCIDSGYEDCP